MHNPSPNMPSLTLSSLFIQPAIALIKKLITVQSANAQAAPKHEAEQAIAYHEPLPFAGKSIPLTDSDIQRAAQTLGCEEAAVRAVIDVESRGGFLKDHRFNNTHPDISSRTTGGYKGGAAEYMRLHQAIALDRDAALRSTSWGAFQIMGDNYQAAGFLMLKALWLR